MQTSTTAVSVCIAAVVVVAVVVLKHVVVNTEPSFVHEKLKIPLFNLINLIFAAIAKLPNFRSSPKFY